MNDAENPGIVCPECGGNLKTTDKVRKGNRILRTHKCLNANCPSRLRGDTRYVYTLETFWMSVSKRANSTGRSNLQKLLVADHSPLPIE